MRLGLGRTTTGAADPATIGARLGLREGSPARRRLELQEAVLDRGRDWLVARERVRATLQGPYTSEWPPARAAEEGAAERLEAALEELDR